MKLEIKYTEIATMKCYFPISLCLMCVCQGGALLLSCLINAIRNTTC